MRKTALLLALLALAALSPPGRGDLVPRDPGAAQAGGKRVAFVVGCNGYGDDAWDLQAAVPDARSVAAFLQEAGYDVTLLTDEARSPQGAIDPANWLPTKPIFERKLRSTFQGGLYGPNDTLVFFFAGHGVKLPDAAGVPQDFLLPLGTPVPPTEGRALVAVEFVRYVMEKSEAGNLVLITDACRVEGEQRSGPVQARGFGERTAAEVRGSGGVGGERRTALMRSCQALQVSRADRDGGWYTKALVAGLRGAADGYGDQGVKDGSVTVAEAHAYAKDQVAELARRKDKEQVPDLEQAGSAARIVLAGRAGGQVKPIALPATLKVTSVPPGATVLLNGREEGTTPLEKRYNLGEQQRQTVQIRLRLDGYAEQAAQVELIAGATIPWEEVALVKLQPAQPAPAPTPTPPTGGRPAGWPGYLSSYQPSAGMSWSSFRVSPKDGMPEVLIPAGEFLMGSPANEKDHQPDEGPQKRVYVSAFWMDLHEVTVGQYQRFCQATGRKMDTQYNKDDRHPVVMVSWDDAGGYAAWAGRQLPTEAQWEKAARGGTTTAYPWGDHWDASKANDNRTGTTAVGSYAPNGLGLFDVSGNVWEWCRDWYDGGWYARMPGRDPENTTPSTARVCRGGSWFYNPSNLRAADRHRDTPGDRSTNVGFRCSEAP